MERKVINNFLTKSYHKELKELMNSANFPWYYNSHISYESGKSPPSDNRFYETGFTHSFWDNRTGGQRDSWYSHFWKPGLYQIMDAVNQEHIIRSRGDMTMYTHKVFEHAAHIDFPCRNVSAVYYLNDSYGDTIFYNEKAEKSSDIPQKLTEAERISPKANRLVVFEGNDIHTGSSPNKHKNRIIINSNFYKELGFIQK